MHNHECPRWYKLTITVCLSGGRDWSISCTSTLASNSSLRHCYVDCFLLTCFMIFTFDFNVRNNKFITKMSRNVILLVKYVSSIFSKVIKYVPLFNLLNNPLSPGTDSNTSEMPFTFYFLLSCY